MDITLKKIYAGELSPFITELAKLRINVFREFPYLYDGDLAYEKNYLKRYLKAQNSLVILAFHNDLLVGASTCLPLSEEDEEFRQPLIKAGFNCERGVYFGESLILSEFRGQKLGHKFFALREEHAQSVIDPLEFTCFCAVDRKGHSLTPKDYRPLDDFWMRMGYSRHENLNVYYAWKDIDQAEENLKKMDYWIKPWPLS